MVRSIFNEKGVYIGTVWGAFDYGSEVSGNFCCRPFGTKQNLGPFFRIPEAEVALRDAAVKLDTNARALTPRPINRQFQLPLG